MEEIVNNIASANTGEMPLVFKNLFEKYVDEDTKTLINKFSNTDDLNERINIMKDYTNKNIPKDKDEKEETDLDDVIRQKHELENKAKNSVKAEPLTVKDLDLTSIMKMFGVDDSYSQFVENLTNADNLDKEIGLAYQKQQQEKNETCKQTQANSEHHKEDAKPEVKIFNLTDFLERACGKNSAESLDDLIRTKNSLDKKISSLAPKEQKEYYAKLYQIPTDKDLHIKLDVILQKLEDLSREISVIRKHI